MNDQAHRPDGDVSGPPPQGGSGVVSLNGMMAVAEKAADAIERLTRIRDEAWEVIANDAWGGRWLSYAERTYAICIGAVGPHPNDTHWERR